MQNSKQFSSAHPGNLNFLMDVSGSMNQPYQEGYTRLGFLLKAVNTTTNMIINSNMVGENPKDRAIISYISYGSVVKELRTDTLSGLANNPLRTEDVTEKVPDGNGGFVEITKKNPIFVEDTAGGPTPMSSAFEVAFSMAQNWMENHPESPAPVILNFTDGKPYVDGEDEEAKTIEVVQKIMDLKGNDGSPLIFNCHIGDGVNKCTFPSSEADCPDEQARFLYKISSEVPDSYRAAAAKLEMDLPEHCKGMVCNADPKLLIDFINFGSSAAARDRM